MADKYKRAQMRKLISDMQKKINDDTPSIWSRMLDVNTGLAQLLELLQEGEPIIYKCLKCKQLCTKYFNETCDDCINEETAIEQQEIELAKSKRRRTYKKKQISWCGSNGDGGGC